MTHSESIANIAKALALSQSEIKNPAKNADNPFFKSKYAPLEDIISGVKGILAKNGIAVLENPITNELGEIGIKTLLVHSSGEYIESDPAFFKPVKNDPQGMGSAITYARRYSISALLNICGDEDDDGNAASAPTPGSKQAVMNGKTPAPKVKFATEEQLNRLSELCDGKQLAALCGKYKVAKISELTEDVVSKLIPQIEKRMLKEADADQAATISMDNV